jgi:V/A-type H+-transporting ATPase subunit A
MESRVPNTEGEIARIGGPVVVGKAMQGARMYEMVRVGREELIGEIIGLEGDIATIQVYEETTGLTPGEPVKGTGAPLSVDLAPGLLGKIYDGIQRPLTLIKDQVGDYIRRGVTVPALERTKKWEFIPSPSITEIYPGDILGMVQETESTQHLIMVPPGLQGTLTFLAEQGQYTIEDTIAKVRYSGEEQDIRMLQRWPVRNARPFVEKLAPDVPLITGQRVIDTFFPLAKGGTAAIPGPFGSGKTVVQHQLAKWVDADIIVYVGCGERGNEMADVLREFPFLEDPRIHVPLMNRTILIANTSNMPVAAREASVYTGITLAEYYRDMGYNVALMADSTSRWAEAMREISGRLEEMPGEEGYPAYLASRLAEFYERSGRVLTLGTDKRNGSITVIGAVSPPGGDFSEPVTQNTLRMVKVFWALDASLASSRHFPAIDWLVSYSLYTGQLGSYYREKVGEHWDQIRQKMMGLLQKESELEEIVQLVGADMLPEDDKLTLLIAEMIRESYLIQYAFDPVETYCPPKKQYGMMVLLNHFYEKAHSAVKSGTGAQVIRNLPVRTQLARMGSHSEDEWPDRFRQIDQEINAAFTAMRKQQPGGPLTSRRRDHDEKT